MIRQNAFKKVYDICNSKNNKLGRKLSVMDIELTNHCNFKCLMCPTGTGAIKRHQGFMSSSIYKKIIDEIKGENIALRFIRWGEPTMHKNFFEYIKMAKDEGILCHFNTNGSLLNNDTLKQVVEMEIESIKFSFQGVDKKSYNDMRNKGDFNELINKLKLLYEIRGDREFPYIHVATTTTYETDEQIKEFKDSIKNYCDLVTVGRTIMEHINTYDTKLLQHEMELFESLKKQQKIVKNRFEICPEVFDKLSVNWDGTITACCGDYDGKMIVGDLHNGSIKEIWNNEKMKCYREILIKNQYEKIELCNTCYNRMDIRSID